MRHKDLQKIGVVIYSMIWITAMKLPDVAFALVVMWAGVLAFDAMDNRGKSRMGMFDGQEN